MASLISHWIMITIIVVVGMVFSIENETGLLEDEVTSYENKIGFSLNDQNFTANNSNNASIVLTNTKVPIRSFDFWDISLLVLLIFGFLGNTLTIAVMSTKTMRHTNEAIFLKSMSFADIFLLALKFISTIQKIYRIPIYNFCPWVHYVLPLAAACTSYWLIILTTMERVIAVLYPFKVSHIFSRYRCYMIMGSMVVFFTLLSSTQAICLQYHPPQPYFCATKGKRHEKCFVYMKRVFPWLQSLFMSWLPSIFGIILNTIIITGLYKASRGRRLLIYNLTRHYSSITEAQRRRFKERQITITLCTISVTFVLFTLPYSLYEVLRKTNPNLKGLNTRYIQRAVMFPLDLLHASNFILYCLTGQRFRIELKRILMMYNKKILRDTELTVTLKSHRNRLLREVQQKTSTNMLTTNIS